MRWTFMVTMEVVWQQDWKKQGRRAGSRLSTYLQARSWAEQMPVGTQTNDKATDEEVGVKRNANKAPNLAVKLEEMM